ncbi:MAG: ISAzo13 family transposase [Actinomycetales bacterium]|nr:ISAzo13 family transposase [Actinomycetales bacterium]
MKTEAQLREQYRLLAGSMDERARREWAASEAMALGRGGIGVVHLVTGLARSTIGVGIRELKDRAAGKEPVERREGVRRVRRPGAGRKKLTERDPTLLRDLERLVEPLTRGDPESPLRWTCKSLRRLAGELADLGHKVSFRTVGKLLKELGYSLQGNRKTLEGTSHPDRNAQFEYINEQVRKQHELGAPAVSVDTKKKELVGQYKNAGREYRPKGEPEKVKVHDFKGELGRANPYGVYDIGENDAWVSVGLSADTGEFAVESIRRWHQQLGAARYREADSLLITADCGGSNGYRLRLWKWELQGLADELGIPITVCHLPPGTSKWNKIEHRLFSFITLNWRGKPLVDYQTIVSLIAATTTTQGLDVRCELDTTVYEKGRKITDAEMATLNIRRHEFHGDWNYTLSPRAGVK